MQGNKYKYNSGRYMHRKPDKHIQTENMTDIDTDRKRGRKLTHSERMYIIIIDNLTAIRR